MKPMSTYQNVLRKAGLEPRSRARKRGTKLLLVAAIVAAATVAAAAAYYSVSDAFRGVVDLHDSAGNASASEPILDRTGILVNETTATSGGVDISLRAAIGDERTVKVLVDVVDTSGNGLAIHGATGEYALDSYSLTKSNGDMIAGGSGYEFVNIDPSGCRFTILFTYSVMGESIAGETLKLHFEDILQQAYLDGSMALQCRERLPRCPCGRLGVDIEDLTVRMTPNTDVVWEGHPLTITSLEVSPYSLFLQYKTDEDTAQRMFPTAKWGTVQLSEWSESYRPVTITMKDGSAITVKGGSLAPLEGAMGTAGPGTVLTEFESQYHIDVVIDPAQIDSIQIGDQSFAPNR